MLNVFVVFVIRNYFITFTGKYHNKTAIRRTDHMHKRKRTSECYSKAHKHQPSFVFCNVVCMVDRSPLHFSIGILPARTTRRSGGIMNERYIWHIMSTHIVFTRSFVAINIILIWGCDVDAFTKKVWGHSHWNTWRCANRNVQCTVSTHK